MTGIEQRTRRASVADTLRFGARVGAPFVAAGAIARRKPVMGLLERRQSNAAVPVEVTRLRQRYGSAPLAMKAGPRTLAVVLSPDDVDTVLTGADDAFTAANREKVAALSPFQPHGVLISRGELRHARRSFNEAILDTGSALHRLAEPFVDVVEREADALVDTAWRTGTLGAAAFTRAWWRVVRQLVFGPAARDDDTLTDELWRLRSDGNWSYVHPVRHRLRDRFTARLHRAAQDAPAESLAGAVAATAAPGAVDAVGQIPHWLFAFDAAGMVTLRTLAVLSTHDEHRDAALAEYAAESGPARPLRRLRDCVLDATRLWPTTPVILRDSLVPTAWSDDRGSHTIPAGTGFAVVAAAFHRDDGLPFAHTFTPEIWSDGRADTHPALVPFSAGPARCPGENLVLLVTSSMLGALLSRGGFDVTSRVRPTPHAPMPATLDHFGLTFAVR